MRRPDTPTEATIVAELYHRARERGLHVALEPVLPRGGRADIAFCHKDGEAYALIEVKRDECANDMRQRVHREQAGKYAKSGLPWCYCMSMDSIDECITWVYEKQVGVQGVGNEHGCEYANTAARLRA